MSTDGHVNGTPVVTATDVTRRYGEGETAVDALRGVSLAVMPGELVAVMGPSGSGKSTLMHILAALDKPTSGTVTIGGEDIGGLTDREVTLLRREHIGFVFQFFNLLPMLTAEENVVAAALDRRREAREGVPRGSAEALGLSDRRNHRPAELSGGQQQRVAIARALVSKPTVVLADEPTGNLDSATSHEILELLRVGDRGLRPDDRDGHPRRRGGRDRRPDPLPERRPDRRRACAQRAGGDPRRDQPDLRLTRDQGRAQGSRRAQAPRPADRVRDRARRRDGVGHLRPHRHDQEGLRHDLHGLVPERRRGRQRQDGVREHEQHDRAVGPGVAARADQGRCPASQDAVGGVEYDQTHLVGRNGKSISTGGAPNLGFSVNPRDQLFNPLKLVAGRWPVGSGRGRDRQGHGRQARLQGRAADRRVGARPDEAVPHRRHRRARRRLDDRRRDHRDLRPADGAEAVPEGRTSSTRSASRRRRRCRRRGCSPRSARSCRRRRR